MEGQTSPGWVPWLHLLQDQMYQLWEKQEMSKIRGVQIPFHSYQHLQMFHPNLVPI